MQKIKDRIPRFKDLGFLVREGDKNSFFWNLHISRPSDSINEAVYSQLLAHVDQYIRLMTKMSESMNDESLNQVKNIGLKPDFCVNMIGKLETPPRIKDSLLRLYTKLYLLDQPRVSSADDSSISFQNLNRLNLTESTLISLYMNHSESQASTDNSDITNFLEHLIKGTFTLPAQVIAEEVSSKSSIAEDYLLFLESLIIFMWHFIDLGYSDHTLNNMILKVVQDILEVTLKQKSIDNWYSVIMEKGKYLPVKKWQLQVKSIIDKCLDILIIFMKIRRRIQVMAYLKKFKESFDSLKKFDCSLSFLRSIFEVWDMNPKQKKLEDTRRSKLVLPDFGLKRAKTKGDRQNQTTGNKKEVETKNLSLQSQIDLLRGYSYPFMDLICQLYYKTASIKLASFSDDLSAVVEVNNSIQKKISSLLDSYFRQREHFSQHINRILLFLGDELVVLRDFSNAMKTGGQDVVSISKLKDKARQIYIDDISIQNQIQNMSSNDNKSSRILEITNIMNKILSKFSSRLFHKRLFKKTQDLLRVLDFHESLIAIFNIKHNDDNNRRTMIETTLLLFEYYVLDNDHNIGTLIPYVQVFVNLIDQRHSSSRVLASLFNYIKSISIKEQILKSIFSEMLNLKDIPNLFSPDASHDDEIKGNRVKLCEYFRVIRALMIQDGEALPQLQQAFAEQLIFCYDLSENLMSKGLGSLAKDSVKAVLSSESGSSLLQLLFQFYSLINLMIHSNHFAFLVISNLMDERTLKIVIRSDLLHPLIKTQLVATDDPAPTLHRSLPLLDRQVSTKKTRHRNDRRKSARHPGLHQRLHPQQVSVQSPLPPRVQKRRVLRETELRPRQLHRQRSDPQQRLRLRVPQEREEPIYEEVFPRLLQSRSCSPDSCALRTRLLGHDGCWRSVELLLRRHHPAALRRPRLRLQAQSPLFRIAQANNPRSQAQPAELALQPRHSR